MVEPVRVKVHPALGSTPSRCNPAGRSISTSPTVTPSTVTPTSIVDDTPTGIWTAIGQMWAQAGATVTPRMAAVAAAEASARTAHRRMLGTLPLCRCRSGAASRLPPAQMTRYARSVRTRLVVPLFISVALLLAACGGGSGSNSAGQNPSTSSPATSPAGEGTTVHVAIKASNEPSVSAKMICETEAATEIYEQATGVKTIAPFHPTWVDHVYSCDYAYPGGAKMTLSVKEVSSPAETTAYFDSLATKLHKTKSLDQFSLGQGSFQVADGSVVVRKDYKILLIDVTKLPAEFGVPADSRGDVAINVAEAIMGCWSGT